MKCWDCGEKIYDYPHYVVCFNCGFYKIRCEHGLSTVTAPIHKKI